MPHKPLPVRKPGDPAMAGPGATLRAMQSNILMISQKMKYLIRNEKILGRNLMVLNKKITVLEKGGIGGTGQIDEEQLSGLSGRFDEISVKLSQLADRIIELEIELARVKDTFAKQESVKELKYVVDSINPLEFVTYKEVDSLIEEKINKEKKEKKEK